MHDAAAIKGRLLTQLEGVLAFLLPAGKSKGHEFCVGSTAGEAGESLKVELRGDRRGVWKDFATGGAGDVFDLWAAVKGVDFKTAFREACSWLGVTHVDRPALKPKPPAPDMADVIAMRDTPAMAYLVERRITEDTLRLYKVRGYARAGEVNKPGDWIAWGFVSPDGEPVMIKTVGIHRKANGKKEIWSSRPWWTLWGWWLVKPHHRRLAITEGEIDAMSLRQMLGADWDVPVLSLPSGAQNMEWIENDFDALQRFEQILLFTDMDPEGEAAAKLAANRLGPARCRRVPFRAGYKDSNHLLCTHVDPDHLEPATWLENSYTFDPPALCGVNDLREDVHALMRRERDADEVNTFLFPRVPFQFRDGEMSLFTGYPFGGKSTFCYQSHLHEMRHGRRVLGCSFEIKPAKMIAELCHMLTGHTPSVDEANSAMNWLNGKLWFVRPPEKYFVPDLVADLTYAAQRFGVTRAFVDSLHHLASKEDYEAQDRVALTLYKLAGLLNIHVGLVCHSGKDDPKKVPGMMDVEGSGGITKPPDNILTLWRNPEKHEKIEKAREADDQTKLKEAEQLPDGLLVISKQRHNGKVYRLKLWFDSDTRCFRDTLAPATPPVVKAEEQKEFF
jgi:twinkle protein